MKLLQEMANAALALYLSGATLEQAELQLKRAFIEECLRDCRGNQVHAATKLGVHRNTLCRDLNELGIDPSRFYGDEKRNGPPYRPAQRALEFARRNCIERRQA
jgi:DNA-binding NtrC family response regulator